MIEYAGPILQLVGFVIGGIVIAATMRTTLRHVQDEVGELKKQVVKLGEILTVQAVQTNRLDTVDRRLDQQERLLDDLRRGEGFIFPLANRLRGD